MGMGGCRMGRWGGGGGGGLGKRGEKNEEEERVAETDTLSLIQSPNHQFFVFDADLKVRIA
ncbi:Os12g0179950 [Oryza sativa Japonica Group]|uniref:Os12g0179950 protein n=1 Tax=Oryza sativa subsp. japonica TaxID=39947 RepID=C7J9Q2_ORYSJ|nr:Os12g0179950 [Oryza sativa Japonica Group]|eukprot:NP_001176819.1 Os12g0179950 [Oryza sativa Japonica Group]